MIDAKSVLPQDRPFWTNWNTLWRPPSIELLNLTSARRRSHNTAMSYVIGAAVVLGREDPNKWWSYSRRRGWYYEHNRPRYLPPISNLYEATISAVDTAAAARLIEHQKMPPGHRDWQSRFRAMPELLQLFRAGGLPLICDPPNRIELRDRNGDLLQYSESRRVQDLRKQLDAFNEAALSIQIELDGRPIQEGDPLVIDGQRFGAVTLTMHRVFTLDFSKHGRWYGPWVQSLKKATRASLTISGDSLREVDYRELHCRILYAEGGKAMPYAPFEIDGWDRGEVKRGFYILVNAITPRDAIGAIAKHVFGGHSRAHKHQAERLADDIRRKHSAIADRFGSDAGLKLMATDAAVTGKNLVKLYRAGIRREHSRQQPGAGATSR